MKLTPGGMAGNLSGLNSVPQALNYVDTVASHGTTGRITHTVAAGKKLHVTYITDVVATVLTGTGDLRRGVLVFVQKAGAGLVNIYQDSTGVDNVASSWEHYQIRDTWLFPGDTLSVQTFDLSTSGSTHFIINIAADLYDI